MKSAPFLFLMFVIVGGVSVRAQTPTPAPQYPPDWTTTDGQHLHNVKVLKVDSDFVTVIHNDGGGIIPLSTLTPDLQKLFNYPHTYTLRMTHGGIRYKDIVVGSGPAPSSNDQLTVTLKPNDPATTDELKTAVDAETKRLQDLKIIADKDMADAQTKYDAATGDAKQEAYVDLQNAQKKEQDYSIKLEALQSDTFTFLFGAPDVVPGLGDVVLNMKSGGKRDINPLPPPPAPSDDDSTPVPTPTPTPTPIPAPNAPPPPPKFSYEVDLIDLQPAIQQ